VTVAVGQRGAAAPDGVLVQEAAAGSGESYGALYDRYAPQVFNYCLRISGSPDDAADATHEAFLNVLRRLQDDDRPVIEFAPYLFATARNESYALMRRGNRVYPAESLPEEAGGTTDAGTDPERAAMLRDSQDAVRTANASLAPRHREVLALRELGERSYDEIGQIMGISENGAAQLIWRARMKLREALTAGAVASVVAMSADCERAQVLLTRIQDGEPVDDPDRAWLDDHLDECGSCRAARGMLLEVGATSGCWLPVAGLIGMRTETLTAAGSLVGADWSGVAAGAPGGGTAGGSAAGGSSTGGGGTAAAVAGVATLAAIGIALSVVIHDDSQIERRLADAVREPAVRAQAEAPKASRKPEKAGGVATIAHGGVAGAPQALRALEQAASRQGNDGTPRSNPPSDRRGPERESKPNLPGNDSPGTGPPGPGTPTPGPDNGPPADTTPPVEPPQPVPDKPAPPVDTTPPPDPPPPPPPQQDGCTWHGGGGGPGGCPPGHGGVPPGHGGVPPGQVGKPPKSGPR
jgi:RNA polymerase sigma factor (sigma-70 family)